VLIIVGETANDEDGQGRGMNTIQRCRIPSDRRGNCGIISTTTGEFTSTMVTHVDVNVSPRSRPARQVPRLLCRGADDRHIGGSSHEITGAPCCQESVRCAAHLGRAKAVLVVDASLKGAVESSLL